MASLNMEDVDQHFFASIVSRFSRKQSLRAFLPSRLAALYHVVERIDALAFSPAEELVMAARKRDVDLVKSLIWNLHLDVVSVAAAAQRETAETINVIRSSFPEWCVVRAIHKATKLDTIKFLFEWIKTNKTKMEALSIILGAAATSGHADILAFAIEGIVTYFSAWLPSKQRGRELSKTGSVLQKYPDVQKLFDSSFRRAMAEGHEDIAATIYAAYPSYPARTREKLFRNAARDGMTNVVKFIYRRGHINTGASNRAFMAAADCSHASRFTCTSRCSILAFLLRHTDIFAETVEMAFTRAIRARSIEVAVLLRETKRIPWLLLNELFGKAIYVDTIQVLFDTELISTRVIEATFHRVVTECIHNPCGDRAGVAKFLSDKECIPRVAVEWAFVAAADANSILLVNALSKSRLLSSTSVSRVFMDACINNHVGIAKVLCKNACISADLAVKTLATTIRFDHATITNFLWGQEWIPYVKHMEVFIGATKTGDLKVVQWFCAFSRASRDSVAVAVQAGAEAGHARVIKRLFDTQRIPQEVTRNAIKFVWRSQ